MVNPFAVTTGQIDERGVFGDHARRVRSGFLYRVIEFDRPYPCQLVYNGRWFLQRITINGSLVWWQISWLTIRPRAEFRVPARIDPATPAGSIEIGFARGLLMRRFRVWIGGQIVYDEVN